MARRPARKPTSRSTRSAATGGSCRAGRRSRQDHRGLPRACSPRSGSSKSALPRLPMALESRWRKCAGNSASTLAILAAHLKAVDRAVLAEDLADMAEEPARERLFDVLMRRLEVLAPHREAVRSLLRSATPQSAAGAGAQWARGTVAAMDADRRRHQRVGPARHDARPGPRGAVRVRSCAPGSMTTIRAWRAPWRRSTGRSARGQRFAGLLDDLCRVPSRLCRLRSRRRRRSEELREIGRRMIAAGVIHTAAWATWAHPGLGLPTSVSTFRSRQSPSDATIDLNIGKSELSGD